MKDATLTYHSLLMVPSSIRYKEFKSKMTSDLEQYMDIDNASVNITDFIAMIYKSI